MTGSELRRRRKSAGLTQTELGRLAGYAHAASVSRWERGERALRKRHIAALEYGLWGAANLRKAAARKGGGA